MARTSYRCPTCSTVLHLTRELDGLALACLGCARSWELASDTAREEALERARLKADPQYGRRVRAQAVA